MRDVRRKKVTGESEGRSDKQQNTGRDVKRVVKKSGKGKKWVSRIRRKERRVQKIKSEGC